MRFQLLGAALALATTASNAQKSTYCPATDKVCYTVSVPSTDATSEIFFQISGPSTMSWIGMGQGSQMAGSNIFVIYADAAGTNVTLSSRLGTGEQQPKSDTSAKVLLLDGSGVVNGMMVANVKCTNCQSWSGGTMDLTSTSTSWIYAYKAGDPVNSDSVSANIAQHDQFGAFTFNLANAAGGDGSVNPFTNTIATSANGNSTTAPSSNVNANSTADMGSGSAPVGQNEQMIMTATTAHGIMGAAVFVILFPSGNVVIRVLNFHGMLWVHVVIQFLGYITALAVMETGVWIAVRNDELMYAHPLIGLVVICGLFVQPFLGLGHHLMYKKQGGRNAFTSPHVWWGRALITLGIINGGLGLMLAGNTRAIYITYGTVASVAWTAWMSLAALTWWRIRQSKANEKEQTHFKDRIVRVWDDNGSAIPTEMINFSRYDWRDRVL